MAWMVGACVVRDAVGPIVDVDADNLLATLQDGLNVTAVTQEELVEWFANVTTEASTLEYAAYNATVDYVHAYPVYNTSEAIHRVYNGTDVVTVNYSESTTAALSNTTLTVAHCTPGTCPYGIQNNMQVRIRSQRSLDQWKRNSLRSYVS